MKKHSLLTVLILFLGITLYAQPSNTVQPNYTLAERFSPKKLRNMVFSTSVNPHWMKDSNRFWYSYKTTSGEFYYVVDPDRKTKTLLFDPVKLAADMSRLTGDPFDAKHLGIQKLKLVNDQTALHFQVTSKLAEEEVEEEGDSQEQAKKSKKPKMKAKVWYFEYDINSKALSIREGYKPPKDKPRWATIAPDSAFILFARDHNLYWMDKENYYKALKDEKDSTIVENQWTTDGVEHYGYQRSNRGRSMQQVEKDKDKRQPIGGAIWSPDGNKFAMIKADSREVGELFVINSLAKPRPEVEIYKYGMPGEKHQPQYELHIFDFPAKSQVKAEVEGFVDQQLSISRAPVMKQDYDDDFRVSRWLAGNDGHFFVTRTSRDLKRIDICKVNPADGSLTVMIEERLNTYVETRTVGLVNGGEEMIQWSERDGWGHFYLYDSEGNMKNQITSGPFHCEGIAGIDERNRVLYFVANGREEGEDPYYLHHYRVNFDGSDLRLLNPGNYNHSPNLNDNNSYFVDNYSRVNTNPKSVLMDRNGVKVMDLETADLSALMNAGYQYPEPYKAKAADGITDIYGVMYKPFDFDSTKSYPIIAYVYPGPQTEAVAKSFSARMDRTDRLAQMGFIVVTMGNRGGHPARSKWYHNYGYGNLRDYGLADKKTVIEQLAAKHDFVDMEKVGIFGHSGGGFMSTAAMLVYPDFFKVAVSSSGNHENNIYNRWWSEKHHGVKEITNDKGEVSFKYDIAKNSELAKNLKGHLMITTGDMDNNVNPALTIRMANALIKANKRFDYFVFPGQRHGYGNMNEYFFWLRADYFAKHLLGSSETSADIIQMNRDR